MTKQAISDKIQASLNQGTAISEDQVRSLMILVRKHLEGMTDRDRSPSLTLNLFCNWCAHVEITQSNTGLRILARINDALVRVKSSTDADQIQTEISMAVGFGALRSELIGFLGTIDVNHHLDQQAEWSAFLTHLLEIIRDVPLGFPPVGKLNNGARRIYDQIAQNPIKPGAGVIRTTISRVNYEALGVPAAGEPWCLVIQTEDTSTTVVPLCIVI